MTPPPIPPRNWQPITVTCPTHGPLYVFRPAHDQADEPAWKLEPFSHSPAEPAEQWLWADAVVSHRNELVPDSVGVTTQGVPFWEAVDSLTPGRALVADAPGGEYPESIPVRGHFHLTCPRACPSTTVETTSRILTAALSEYAGLGGREITFKGLDHLVRRLGSRSRRT